MTRLLLAVLAGLVLLTGCASTGEATAPPPQAPQPIAARQETPNRTPIGGYRITLPTLGVSSSLIPVGLNADRTLQVPPLATPMQAGLFEKGPRPGEDGPAVVVAHINAGGQAGLFSRLAEMQVGDTVEVARPGGVDRFTVYRTTVVPKGDYPTREVYSDVPGPELRLISCGGDLDATRSNYLSNVVVFARKS